MRRLVAATVVAALALAVGGCSGSPPTDAPDASLEPLIAVAERGGVRVTLTLDGPPAVAVRSWASVRVENVGAGAVRWRGGGCDHPATIAIDLRAAFDPGREWPGALGRFKQVALGGPFGNPAAGSYVEESLLPRPGAVLVACTADLQINELAAGGVLTMRAAWDGQVGETTPAPPGPAIVSASFPFIGHAGVVPPDLTDAKPITATIETAVVGPAAGAALSPALAIDAALGDERFAAFVQATPEREWINPHIVLDDGVWGIGLFVFARGGQGESFGEVKVDATGAIVGHRFE